MPRRDPLVKPFPQSSLVPRIAAQEFYISFTDSNVLPKRRACVESEWKEKFPMATIPPLVAPPTTARRPAAEFGWATFHLLFLLAVSGLVNVFLVLRLATIR
jgi:hypothetical protein